MFYPIVMKEELILFNDALNTFFKTYGYMASETRAESR